VPLVLSRSTDLYRLLIYPFDRLTHFQVGRVLSERLRKNCRNLFRLKAIRDTFVRPVIDEPGVAAINSVMNQTIREICNDFYRDTDYISLLLDIILSDSVCKVFRRGISARGFESFSFL
jgi:hypothetical protein